METILMAGLETIGVLYIVFGARYQAEARTSIRSLRKVSPDLRIAVITDSEWTTDPLPDLFIMKATEASYALKMRYACESPFDRTLCLDSDTLVARDIQPVFGLLDHYDVGFHFNGPPIQEPNGLQLHMRAATSVFLFGRNERVSAFFSAWSSEYSLQLSDLAARGQSIAERGMDDTRSCAIAVAKSGVRPVQLGSFLYFDLGTPTTTCYPPLIYHGRLPLMERVVAEVTDKWDPSVDWFPRLWLPSIRGLLPRGIRGADPVLAAALLARRIYNTVRRRLRQ